MKAGIIHELRNTFQTEINTASKKIQQNVDDKISKLKDEQNVVKGELKEIYTKIKKIEENLNLNTSSNPRKFVLFGFPEQINETEYDLYENVSKAFSDIMSININPFVEDIQRIGRKGKTRPLVIELTNKRMAKYILRNNKCLRNTGLAVDTFVEGQELKERTILKQNLRDARRNGNHAIIKNNKLFVNGKEMSLEGKIEQSQQNTTIGKEMKNVAPPALPEQLESPSPNCMNKSSQPRTTQNNRTFR